MEKGAEGLEVLGICSKLGSAYGCMFYKVIPFFQFITIDESWQTYRRIIAASESLRYIAGFVLQIKQFEIDQIHVSSKHRISQTVIKPIFLRHISIGKYHNYVKCHFHKCEEKLQNVDFISCFTSCTDFGGRHLGVPQKDPSMADAYCVL